MRFLYCNKGGGHRIVLDGDEYHYIFRVRREKGDIYIRNPENPEMLYRYRQVEVKRRKAVLELVEENSIFVKFGYNIVLGWSIVDPKVIEKNIHMANELGVSEIALIYADRSQKNFKINLKRLEKIVKFSSMQSGRYDFAKISIYDSVDKFISKYPNAIGVDFSHHSLAPMDDRDIQLVIGPEGGFTERERRLFKEVKGLSFPYILRSETAIPVAIASVCNNGLC